MSNQDLPKHDYDVSENDFYELLENGAGSTTDEIAYAVLGEIAYQAIRTVFSDSQMLRIGDVGCYLGGSSARWHEQGNRDDRVSVLGTDIYEANIQKASHTYKHISDLSFVYMEAGSAIPLIDGQLYHGIFATFVLDAIHQFEDVKKLCQNMVNALLPDGEIYLLRLHPNSLRSQIGFKEYQFQTKPNWTHGDRLSITLTNGSNAEILIDDRYWEPRKIAEVFELSDCEVALIDLSFASMPEVASQLEIALKKFGLDESMPEWAIPLYQIIRVKKNELL